MKGQDNEPIKGTFYKQAASVDFGTQDVSYRESDSKEKGG